MSSNSATCAKSWCIAAAMPGELAAIKRLCLSNVTYLTTGVGTRNAERAVLRAMATARPGGIIHVGYGGALSPKLGIGDVLIAEAVCGVCEASVDSGLTRIASRIVLERVHVRSGVLVTNDRVLATAGDKRGVAASLSEGVLACADMESAVVARICEENAIPYLGIRCITDRYDENLPLDLNFCRDQDGNIATGRVIWALARKPTVLPGLLELRRRANLCSANLARVVAAVLAQVPSNGAQCGDSA